MKTRNTSACSRYSHPEISITADDAANDGVMDNIIAGLERQVAEGKHFRDSETIQMGCGLLQFKETRPGWLELQEPDYHSFPIIFRAEVSATIRQLHRQAEVMESLPERMFQRADPSSILHSALICSEFGREGTGFLLRRSTSSDSDSGWFIGCLTKHDHNDPSNLRRESIYRVLLACPDLSDFLHLPPGCSVQFIPGRALVIYDEGMQPVSVAEKAPIRQLYPFLK
jgi:hypothetical protein